ncbi:MAG TPA: hypothetical protein VEQ35_03670 [Beijerinckia sp.]|jgi:hypothetical protein|nr:hypothetical protein [Beijerinckia sp.]
MTDRDDDDTDAPTTEWDEALAASLIGKYVIAGFIYLERDGISVRERVQVHGIVVDATRGEGFTLSLKGKRLGETLTLPPNTNAFIKADAGKYRLKGTNELVYDPDYTSLWTINMPVLH